MQELLYYIVYYYQCVFLILSQVQYNTKLVMTIMIASILLCSVLLLQGIRVSSVTPGGQQSECFNQVNAYRSTQKPLLNSYWYASLLGTGAVWECKCMTAWLFHVHIILKSSLSWYYSSGLEGWLPSATPLFKLVALKVQQKTTGCPHSSSPCMQGFFLVSLLCSAFFVYLSL